MIERTPSPIEVPHWMYSQFLTGAQLAASMFGVELSTVAVSGLLVKSVTMTVEGEESSITRFMEWVKEEKAVTLNQ